MSTDDKVSAPRLLVRGRDAVEVFDRLGEDREELHQWLIMDTWACDDAMALIAGVIPREIYAGMGYHKFEGGLLHDEQGERSERLGEIARLKRLWRSNPENPETARPETFFQWAAQKGIEIDWLDAARHFGYFKQTEQKSNEDAEAGNAMGTRERETMLKLVIGMAIRGYKFDPTAKKNTAVKEIVEDLAHVGIELSDDTVRHYLKEASSKVLPSR